MGDEDTGTAVRYVLDSVVACERWADEHPDLADATVAWWAEARSRCDPGPAGVSRRRLARPLLPILARPGRRARRPT
ncbi:MAG: hypothetical protein M0Z42_12075 [Actinomycetota bacterium]|nr:hypothetical protein [Actinomycetota bacterium]